MNFTSFFAADDPALNYAITHVFFPVKVPEDSDYTIRNDVSLVGAVSSAVHAYSAYSDDTLKPRWNSIKKMLDNLQASIRSEQPDNDEVVSQLGHMQSGDILAFLIRAQHAAVVFRKQEGRTMYESFEVSATRDAVLSAGGSLVCSYAKTAIEILHITFDNAHFQDKLASLLSLPARVTSDLAPDLGDVTAMVTEFVRSVGYVVDGPCISKHVRDEVGHPGSQMDDWPERVGEWRRSSLWLLIRVAIQTSLDRSALGRVSYKAFMLFFISNLAMDAHNAGVPGDLLHLMSAKILRRLTKFRSSTPDWLFNMALKTCARLQDTLDIKGMELQAAKPSSPHWNPFGLDLIGDARLSLPRLDEYIHSALADLDSKPPVVPFHPETFHRGTLQDFLSADTSFFDKAYSENPYVTLYDVEQSIEQGIDHWLAHVTNVEEACIQLGTLMDIYLSSALVSYTGNPEYRSILILTVVELLVALDKLVVGDIPLLAEYPPEIPIPLLHSLLLREVTNLQRLSRVYQYLTDRRSKACLELPVLTDKFTAQSFPARYCDSSNDLQVLKGRIEAETTGRVVSGDEPHLILQNCISRLPLLPKFLAFELRCPVPFRVWRSAIAHLLYRFDKARIKLFEVGPGTESHALLSDIPELQPYLSGNLHQESPRYSQFQLCCILPEGPRFNYLFKWSPPCSEFAIWSGDAPITQHTTYYDFWLLGGQGVDQFDLCLAREGTIHEGRSVARYVGNTVHTSNDVLSVQTYCPPDFSLDGFIAFGHLRSGGTLQWINVLRELRARALDFGSREVHFLLAQATSQVGFLDVNTGDWMWHQELQDPCFCNALLSELESLFLDVVSFGSLNEVTMHTISLLLTRVLASSPCEDTSERALWLLREVRRKTLGWVQELAYDLMKAPTNTERRQRLCNVVAACQSTFDVGPHFLCKVVLCAVDVHALLSCAFFMQATSQVPNPKKCSQPNCQSGHFVFSSVHDYSGLLHQRNCRLFTAVEVILRDAIQTDVTNQGIDLAVRDIWPRYQPGPGRWRSEQSPDSHWLESVSAATRDRRSRVVCLNLLDGSLFVDGQPLGRLPHEIREHPLYKQVFDGQTLRVVPSDLPGMDLMTLVTISDHYVHFSLRGEDLMIRAQHKDTHDILELIPPAKLMEDLPKFVVEKHVHWLNRSTSIIEIRPLESIWKHSPKNWRIVGTPGEYRIHNDCEALVNVHSRTWVMVSGLLQGLDPPENLVVTTPVDHPPTPRLSVTLPHHGLSFSVNVEGDLESNDFKDMIYDRNQCIETLFGLESRLVLRTKGRVEEGSVPRCILVPINPFESGLIPGWRELGFLGSHPITYHVYKVDTTLGCLTGNPSLESKYFLSYLHAKTSIDWRPDPLTGRTGAQEALSILGSAGFQSLIGFMKPHSLMTMLGYVFNISSWCPRIVIPFARRFRIREPLESLPIEVRREFLGWTRSAGRAAYLFPPASSEDSRSNVWHVLPLQLTPRLEDNVYVAPHEGKCTVRLRRMFGEPSDQHPPASQSADAQGFSSTHRCNTIDTKLSSLPYTVLPSQDMESESLSWTVTLDQLFFKRRAPILPDLTKLSYDFNGVRRDSDGVDTSAFCQVLSTLRGDSPFQERYITDLHASARRVREESLLEIAGRTVGKNCVKGLERHLVECRKSCMDALDILKRTLGPTVDPLEQALTRGGQWPQITTDTLLRCLASTSSIKPTENWKKCLASYSLLLLEFQRTRRLLCHASEGLEEEFLKELENKGCDEYAEEHPDWLLIQLQGDFLIRGIQADIATKMISPQHGKNTVMQVNIGEGKSSVIIPIVATTIANGHQLARVIVPKALAVQMFHLLVDRLGGLADRLIYHRPFSRSSQHLDRLAGNVLYSEMSQCMEERGILLVQPEHVLSIKLTSVEKQLPEIKLEVRPSPQLQKLVCGYSVTNFLLKYMKNGYPAKVLRKLSRSLKHSFTRQDTDNASQGDASESLELQKWLHLHARDILDESDDILHTRRQLIYTIGHHQHVQGYPDRWTVIQQVLRLVRRNAYSLSQDLPDSVEYENDHQPGSFPHFRLLRTSDAGRRLVLLLVGNVMTGHLPNFFFQSANDTQREAIRNFIFSEDIHPDEAKEVEEYAKYSRQGNLWGGLLLLRGLFASNILLFALTERRWRVDYGLDLNQHGLLGGTNLAIPYRAKDVPAPDTQFGHPDVTILLTCLSYYYTGLSNAQLRISFQKLLNEDDPAAEYALWVQDCGPASRSAAPFRDLKAFNLESSEQWDSLLFPFFSYNQAAIDFYLSRIIFPKEVKEYPWKLATSSWDLVEKRKHPITGFSGTNDSRCLLPTSVTVCELDHQQGATARVLAYLLKPENDFYILTHEIGQPIKTRTFLKTIANQQPEIRVLLDVGAQILDVSNRNLAEEWLNLTTADGAIYFDKDDNLMVLLRNGISQPLMSSSFAHRLDRCVIYLDDAHTRGTDLKFPSGFRAAVTLSSKITKDQLVQGCMRMRKLGNGHSVMFFAPLEVDQSIRSVTHKEDQSIRITTADILKWAIHETWSDIQQWAPHWARQGIVHKARYDTWSRFSKNEITREQLADPWLQPEFKSLVDLYAPSQSQNTSGSALLKLEKDIERRCKSLGIAMSPIHSAQLNEQLERHVSREIEREQEAVLPPEAKPVKHFLHPDVVSFVQTGVLRASDAFRPVFAGPEKISAVTRGVWSPFILATADFCNTIEQVPKHGRADQYLRPVQWVLSGKKNNDRVLVVLSPFEVDRLMPDIRRSSYVHLHVYVPRTSKRMKPTDDLKFYSIPPLPDSWIPPWDLIDQLNVFAGQLYLRDLDAYLRLSHLVGIQENVQQDRTKRTSLWNLFDFGSWNKFRHEHPDSLLPSVMTMLASRRRGLPFATTHMGKILQGQPLTEKDFAHPEPAESSHDLTGRGGQMQPRMGPRK